jgi:hypothetical protein
MFLIVWSIGLYVTGMLLTVDVSTATWSPHQHPQQYQSLGGLNSRSITTQEEENRLHQSQNNNDNRSSSNSQGHWKVISPGGSTMIQSPPQPQEREQNHHPQQLFPEQYYHHQQQQLQEQQQQHEEEFLSFFPPQISLKHVSMALRLTSEWNRRLVNGVTRLRQWGKDLRILQHHPFDQYHNQYHTPDQHHQQQPLHPQHHHDIVVPSSQALQEPYGDIPINVHPSRTWQPPIQERSLLEIVQEEEENYLSVFHVKAPRESWVSSSDVVADDVDNTNNSETTTTTTTSNSPRGVCYWGPELLPYLEHIVDVLDVQHQQGGIEIPLAMIYMDRACSVETSRSSGISPCPYCTPRTVHRLSLVALLLSVQAVHGRGRMEEAYQRLVTTSSSSSLLLGMAVPSQSEIREMIEWMEGALGDTGLTVTVPQMRDWSRSWESIFSSSSSSSSTTGSKQQQQQDQQQLLVRQQNELQQLEVEQRHQHKDHQNDWGQQQQQPQVQKEDSVPSPLSEPYHNHHNQQHQHGIHMNNLDGRYDGYN